MAKNEKVATKKLVLARETLQVLKDGELTHVAGGQRNATVEEQSCLELCGGTTTFEGTCWK